MKPRFFYIWRMTLSAIQIIMIFFLRSGSQYRWRSESVSLVQEFDSAVFAVQAKVR